MDMHDQALHHAPRRRDSRLRLGIPAQLQTTRSLLKAVLLDLSQSGAHLALPEYVPAKGDAVLTWLNFEAFARIVWAEQRQIGLEFDELLTPAVLIATRDRADRNLASDEKRKDIEAARAWYHSYR